MGPLDGRQWANLVALFSGGRSRRRRKILLLLQRDGEVLKALHSQRGVLRGVRPDLERLDLAAQEHDAELVICLCPEDIGAVFTAAESQLDPRADYVEQILGLVRDATATVRSRVQYWPKPPRRLRLPSFRRVQRVFNMLWPDASSIGLFVLEDGASGLHASLLLTKDDGRIVELCDSEALQLEGADLDGFTTVTASIEHALAARQHPPLCNLFIERATLLEVGRSRRRVAALLSVRRQGRALLRPYPLKLRLVLQLLRLLGR
ncbi:MAG: hypothetical protein P9M14_02590 [Candidatus Alcyoniella australis]|nr:hypothetical protein [Candidatus Alcyoniella australis]